MKPFITELEAKVLLAEKIRGYGSTKKWLQANNIEGDATMIVRMKRKDRSGKKISDYILKKLGYVRVLARVEDVEYEQQATPILHCRHCSCNQCASANGTAHAP